MKRATPRMTTYRRAQRGRALVCDVCGAVVESTERARVAHTAWHQNAEVIDVRERRTEAVRHAH